jgi:enamine deaminase RidA (YjgF/YER057c/UK114 family)
MTRPNLTPTGASTPQAASPPPLNLATVSARLAEQGHELPVLPAPRHAYQLGTVSGGFVHVSGQTPKVAGELVARGICGREIDIEEARQAAELCALNAIAALHAVTGLESVESLVKVTVFVASTVDFAGQADVADAASELLVHAFGRAGRHARSAIGVACLPGRAPVEVELSAYCQSNGRPLPVPAPSDLRPAAEIGTTDV